MTNPLYGVPGLRAVAEEKLKDPQRLPLFIAIDAFMNETTALADYIVPDTHNFESWGFSAPWAGVASKATTARWPVVPAATAKTADGEPASMEAFCIAVAKRLNLPGFGENAITDAQGNRYPLHRAEDYYLRMAANIAFLGKAPVAEAISEDLTLTGVQRILPVISQTLKADEVSRVAFVYSAAGASRPTQAVARRIASVNCGKNRCKYGTRRLPPTATPSPASATAAARHGIRPDCPTDALSKRFSRDSSGR